MSDVSQSSTANFARVRAPKLFTLNEVVEIANLTAYQFLNGLFSDGWLSRCASGDSSSYAEPNDEAAISSTDDFLQQQECLRMAWRLAGVLTDSLH